MASETEHSKPELGIWIRFWDLALAFGVTAADLQLLGSGRRHI